MMPVQRKATNGQSPAPANPAQIQAQLKTGSSLDGSTRTRMEGAFGTSFSDVKVHTDARASALSDQLQARAFTVGSDVAFRAGAYQPGTLIGDALLAHELAHVVQQRSSQVETQPKGEAYNALETDADNSAVGAVAGLWGKTYGFLKDLSKNALPRLKSGLQLQRCKTPTRTDFEKALGQPSMVEPPEADVKTQSSIVPELRKLYSRKAEIILKGNPDDFKELDKINNQIAEGIRTLRELGVAIPDEDINRQIMSGGQVDFLQMKASLLMTPARTAENPSIQIGERVNFFLNLNYIPPNTQVKVRWVYQLNGRLFPLMDNNFMTGLSSYPAPMRGTQFSFDDATWFALSHDPNLEKAADFQVATYVYFGNDTDHYVYYLRTNTIRIARFEPTELGVQVENSNLVSGTNVRAHLTNWAPPYSQYMVDWFLDGQLFQADQPILVDHNVDGVGVKTLRAAVYRINSGTTGEPIKRMHPVLGPTVVYRDPNPFLVKDSRINVEKADTVAERALQQNLAKVPLDQYPDISQARRSVETSITSLKTSESKGGTSSDYFKERRKMQEKRLERFDKNAGNVSATQPLPDNITTLPTGVKYARPVPAGLLVHQTGELQPLSVYLLLEGTASGWTATLIDMTSADVYEFDGTASTAQAAIVKAFSSWGGLSHPYPRDCTLIHSYAPAGFIVNNKFATNNPWNHAKVWIDRILMVGGMVVAGLLLLIPEPTGLTKALGIAIAAASIARGVIAIAENIHVGIAATDSRNVLEGIGIVTSMLGISGSTLRTAGLAVARPFMYRMGNWMVISSLAIDAGTLVFATYEAIRTIQAIRADPTMDETQKLNAIISTIGSLTVNGLMFFAANHDLFQGGFRKSDFFRQQVKGDKLITLDRGTQLDMIDALRKSDPTFNLEQVRKMPPNELVVHFFTVQEQGISKSRLREFLTEGQIKGLTPDEVIALNQADETTLRNLKDRPASEVALLAQQISQGKASGITGGVKGRDVYPLGESKNFRTIGELFSLITNARGVIIPELATRLHGSTLSHSGKNTFYDLSVPVRGTKGGVNVEVTVVPKGENLDIAGSSRPTTPTHGAETGPASFVLKYEKGSGTTAGRWTATVEIDPHVLVQQPTGTGSRARSEDLNLLLGHELDEIADIVLNNHSLTGESKGTTYDAAKLRQNIESQTQSSKFRAVVVGTSVEITSHDVASVRELLFNYKAMQSANAVAYARDRFLRLMNNMGFTPEITEVRFRDLLSALQRVEADAGFARLIESEWRFQRLGQQLANLPVSQLLPNGRRVVTPIVIEHIVAPQNTTASPSSFVGSGISGGHQITFLEAVNASGESRFFVVREGSAMGLPYGPTARRYRQYMAKEGVNKATAPRPTPVSGGATAKPVAGTHYDPSYWVVSEVPKSAVDDLQAFLPQAERAFADYYSSQIAGKVTTPQSGTLFTHQFKGVTYMGYYNYDGATANSLSINSIFVDAKTIP
ncbi:hypothetical protein CWM47_25365 [Spirosoma pollinicola]|uniref:eCIS core domain-containing protein n=2 Tax=Spirosoma pollinicola TaxID=2057025 RepID=A0A2K8ZCB6_9BACT|nr:hypothetical protein CWM47_25365 [Spirosoma pollinicola]